MAKHPEALGIAEPPQEAIEDVPTIRDDTGFAITIPTAIDVIEGKELEVRLTAASTCRRAIAVVRQHLQASEAVASTTRRVALLTRTFSTAR
jgi:hypothetical protein